jgi:hypothetical protein
LDGSEKSYFRSLFKQGIAFAWSILATTKHTGSSTTDRARGHRIMKKDTSQTHIEEAPKGISLETIIAVGVFGWMALGVVMMGLGIW